jgi:predicted transcriptional regulator
MRLIAKNKLKLLRLFYSHPEQEYYIQEIGRVLGNKPGAYQRALNDLEKEGILSSYYRANARFFKTNKHYPMYAELKSIVYKTKNV